MEIILKLFFKFLCAVPVGGLYTLVSFVVTFGIYKMKGKDTPNDFEDVFANLMIANVIIFFLLFLFFNLEELSWN